MILFLLLVVSIIICVYIYRRSLFVPLSKWNIALFYIDDDVVSHNFDIPDKVFSPCPLRTSFHYTSGYADPFLFAKDGFLYLFYEKEVFEGRAVIEAKRTNNLKNWQNLGTILSEDIHLSYPNVFEIDGHVYMIPETHQAKSVIVYEAKSFPYDWHPVKTLLSGEDFVDSDVFNAFGLWYLMTTVWKKSERPELRLYYSRNMLGDYQLHPASPISRSMKDMRCGGSILLNNGNYYRFAQDCSAKYGQNLAIKKIDVISESSYSENLFRFIHPSSGEWDKSGGHHFNSVNFMGRNIVAMDFRSDDSWLNCRTTWLFRIIHNLFLARCNN